jgi:hypothetical protein
MFQLYAWVLLSCLPLSVYALPVLKPYPLKGLSCTDLDYYAGLCGLKLKVIPNMLFLRIDAIPIDDTSTEPEPIGYLTAFIRPWPLLLFQLDTIQVQNRRQTLGFSRRDSIKLDGPGISFILGSYALRWAYEKGCRSTQLLAVKDSEEMHKVLVRLYQSFGFKVIKELDDTVDSVADRLIWGAEGSLMQMDITSFFDEWTPKFAMMVRDKEESFNKS